MRITITQSEEVTALWDTKVFVVSVEIIFSEVERAVIRTRRLEQHAFADYYKSNGDHYLIEIGDFVRSGQRYTFLDYARAKNFEGHIRSRLPGLKSLLVTGVSPGNTSTFDL